MVTNIEKKRLSLTLTQAYVDALDSLVEEGLYLERQVAIREGLRLLFKHHGMELFPDPEPPEEPP